MCDAPPPAGPQGPPWAGTLAFAEEGDSTMDLGRAAVDAPHGHSWVLARQRRGRGRLGRRWASHGHRGLWMTTCVLAPWRGDLPTLTLVAGLSLLRVAAAAGATAAVLKWPNDLLVGERKAGGILVEAEGTAATAPACRLLVGVGLNLAPPPAGLGGIGLDEILAAPPSVRALASALDAALADDVGTWLAAGLAPFLPRLRAHDGLFGAEVEVLPGGDGAPWRGRAAGIAASGALCLQTADGLRQVVAGEVRRVRALPTS